MNELNQAIFLVLLLLIPFMGCVDLAASRSRVQPIGLQTQPVRYPQGILQFHTCFQGEPGPISLFVEMNTCIPLDSKAKNLRYQVFFLDNTTRVLWNIYGFPSASACAAYSPGSAVPGCCNPTVWSIPSEITLNCQSQKSQPSLWYGLKVFPGQTYAEASANFSYVNMTYNDVSFPAFDDVCEGEPMGGTFVQVGSCFQDPQAMFLNTATKYGFDFYQISTENEIIGYHIDENGKDASIYCTNIKPGLVNFGKFGKASNLTALEGNCTRQSIFYSTGYKNRGNFFLSYPLPIVPMSKSTITCFAGTETVLLESGVRVPISEIRVGDRILSADKTGTLSFAPVIVVPHARNYIRSEFIHIVTNKLGMDIKMTLDHMIPYSSNCDRNNFKLTRASAVLVNGCVDSEEGMLTVISTEEVYGISLYSAVTTNEYILVNGIVASPFAVSHATADSFYNLLRIVYRFLPGVFSSQFFFVISEYLSVGVSLLYDRGIAVSTFIS